MTNIVKDFLYKEESYQVIDAAKIVWRNLGGGFKEKVAEKAYIIELNKAGLLIEPQKPIKIYYDNKYIGTYVPDLIINNKIIIELKCKPFIAKGDIQQLWHYLKATDYKLGFIVNFSPRGVQFKRIVFDKARKKITLV